jgi:hypothetical protein
MGKLLPLELPEESEIVIEEKPDIFYPILENGDSIDSHAPGETGITRIVDPRHAQDFRVAHSGAQDFDPTTLLAF